VALASAVGILAARQLDEARRHARDLAPQVGSLLAERGWQPQDITAVIVSLGPGSYTGLRVGVMSAKTFAYATGCELLGVSTFAAIAIQAPKGVVELDVIADAQKDKIYLQQFVHSADGWMAATPLRIGVFADWLSSRSKQSLVTGPGLHRRAPDIPGGERIAPESIWDPRPESVLAAGLKRFLAGERDDVYKVEPLYLRPSSAEEQWRARPGN
jgi:tRNA threonylcarbamoyladenosine biosynthesis protein TsaB